MSGTTPNAGAPCVRARVVSVERVGAVSSDGVVLGGQLVQVRQDDLLEPFVRLLESIEQLATAAAERQTCLNDEVSIRMAYRALYLFFHTLLPSASHQVIDGLTYSVALLLVGEAIETARAVVDAPAVASEGGRRRETVQERSRQ